MKFTRGQHIEVASKEEGYMGSYYEAIVITEVLRQEYIVQYKTLLKDDLSAPLREVVAAAEIRPSPPHVAAPARGFKKRDKVDALDNEGWWVGVITKVVGTKYYVYFRTTGEELEYDVGSLRVHQDWVRGKWVVAKRG
ncbi:hypothetical protein Leryth_007079 [Lithospermum erythrorhizon]|nr:hypothetical protein Leryth_007079 [Lithospermum erythrorhizon]